MKPASNLEMDYLRGRIGSSAAIFVNRYWHRYHRYACIVEIFGQHRPTPYVYRESDGQIKFPQETQKLYHTEVLALTASSRLQIK